MQTLQKDKREESNPKILVNYIWNLLWGTSGYYRYVFFGCNSAVFLLQEENFQDLDQGKIARLPDLTLKSIHSNPWLDYLFMLVYICLNHLKSQWFSILGETISPKNQSMAVSGIPEVPSSPQQARNFHWRALAVPQPETTRPRP
jgi:hypothetical protein